MRDTARETAERIAKEKFWNLVEKSEHCWVWRGVFNDKGYGYFRWMGVNTGAHRIAYRLLVGPIPNGLTIDHLCRVRSCVNPAHMEPVTSGENTLRGLGPTSRNARKTHCIHGHAFDQFNTRIVRSKGGFARECLPCMRRRNASRYLPSIAAAIRAGSPPGAGT